MISNQETLNLSPYMAIYDIVVLKDNMLRQINELVDFSFILEELKTKYCLVNGSHAFLPKESSSRNEDQLLYIIRFNKMSPPLDFK